MALGIASSLLQQGNAARCPALTRLALRVSGPSGKRGRNPALSGTISVRFAIHREGKLSDLVVPHASLLDCDALECVRAAFRELVFPTPKGGIVTVQYPCGSNPADFP